MNNSIVTPKLTKTQIRNELWRRGELFYKCHAVQQEMYKLFYQARPNSTSVWLLGRQSGKSTLLAILALETALRSPNSVIKLVTDTKVHVKSIFEPIFRDLLVDCPGDLQPKYNSTHYVYVFGNGSQVQLAGSDGKHYEKLRGQKSSLVLIDEAGFCSDLDSMVLSVLLPTTTHTGGKIVLASTPPEDLTHPFIEFMEKAEINGNLVVKTLDDNPLLSPEQKKNIEEQMGGRNSEKFQREYLCILIKDTDTSVIKEFTEELAKEIVQDWARPAYFDGYESMDLGFEDLTAVLFAYYDYRADKIIIEDELPFNFNQKDNNIEKLTKDIEEKEHALWFNTTTGELRAPYLRVSDINLIATNEIRKYSNYRINFTNARKDDKHSAINNLRLLLSNKKIIISPKCTTLVRHLKNARWNKNKDKFIRSVDDSHYDFVDALVYLVRHVNFAKNPYPKDFGLNLRQGDMFSTASSPNEYYKTNSEQACMYRTIFGMKKTRKNG